MSMNEPYTGHVAKLSSPWEGLVRLSLFLLLLPFLLLSCSENIKEDTEYSNWQKRYNTFFDSLEDSLAANPGTWAKFKSYMKDQSLATGKNTDCIYVKMMTPRTDIVSGDLTTSPASTDSVLVTYIGRLIPSASYPEGYVFDTRAYRRDDPATNATERFPASSPLVEGFCTALYHMHRGDHWRVYIPYAMGYGSTKYSSIPAYSTLIFDLTLLDFSPVGESLPVWRAPRKR